MLKLKYLIILIINTIIFSNGLFAQFYQTGTLPFFTQWKQISTGHFNLIFPEDAYPAANRLANTLEKTYSHSLKSMPTNVSHFPVILNNQSALSNGYVVWAPRRMEVVSTPSQHSYTHGWIEQLALHEFRHVAQMNSLNKGLTKGLQYTFGQMSTGGMSAFVPLWLLEGDAVVNETALTLSGRGRQAFFQKEIKALEASGIRYSYDQSYLGSYRYFIPDHYRYGYFMASYARKEYGSMIWSNVLQNVGRRPFTIAPFYFGLKKVGTSKVQLYNQSLDDYKVQMDSSNRPAHDQSSAIRIPTAVHRTYTSYTHPVVVGSRLFAFRSGIDDVTRIVELVDGRDVVVHTPGLMDNSKLAASD